MIRSAMSFTFTAAMVAAAPASAAVANVPVASLDLQHYAGQWHEIAHLPMFFQRQCVDQITATYTAEPDGTIAVHNACRAKNGKMDASDGVATRVPGQPGALKVRFAPRIFAWLPWVRADYWVVELDPDYSGPSSVGRVGNTCGCCRARPRWRPPCLQSFVSAPANAATRSKNW